MDFILEGLDHLLEVVSADLCVFNDTTDLDLGDTVGNGDLLVLGLPEESVQGNGDDLLGKGVKIGLGLVWLDLEDDEGLGNGSDLNGLGCLLSLLLRCLESCLGLLY